MIASESLKTDDYLVPGKKHKAEIKVKGSRFICTVVPCGTRETAEKEYAQIKKKYYDASHNCFAWRINKENYRFSDDGEPAGTAGKPILQAVDAKKLNEILCVVTRYFGGTKLGTGGLIRAYGDCATNALNTCSIKVKTHWAEITLHYNYSLENIIRKIMTNHGGKILHSEYSEIVKMTLALPRSLMGVFKIQINDQTNSSIKMIER